MRHRRRRSWLFWPTIVLLVGFVVAAGFLSWGTFSLRNDRHALQREVATLQTSLSDANARESDVRSRLSIAETKLSQLSTDATGKDAIIKQLQDDTTAKQGSIDALTAERAALKGCLDGVTLALVQLTNDGSATARTTIDGVRDVCRQAEVLL